MRERERTGNSQNSTARYGYSDYLSEEREYGVYYRIWPGKQKILLWGDPALAAGYGRHASFNIAQKNKDVGKIFKKSIFTINNLQKFAY